MVKKMDKKEEAKMKGRERKKQKEQRKWTTTRAVKHFYQRRGRNEKRQKSVLAFGSFGPPTVTHPPFPL